MTRSAFHTLFRTEKAVLAMIHLLPLPGTPGYRGSTSEILEAALTEAEIYQRAGVHGIVLENMHDVPYLKGDVGPEITAMMSVVAREVKAQTGLPCGVQVLAGANREALAVALAARLDFVRVEGFVFAHVADEGLIEAGAGELLRYRRAIGAEQVAVFTDIKKKHSAHALTADVDIVETARAAAFFRSDGLIVTGTATGAAAEMEELRRVREAVPLPILVGSGITAENVNTYLPVVDGLIVGSYFKGEGHWANPVEEERVRRLMEGVGKN